MADGKTEVSVTEERPGLIGESVTEERPGLIGESVTAEYDTRPIEQSVDTGLTGTLVAGIHYEYTYHSRAQQEMITDLKSNLNSTSAKLYSEFDKLETQYSTTFQEFKSGLAKEEEGRQEVERQLTALQTQVQRFQESTNQQLSELSVAVTASTTLNGLDYKANLVHLIHEVAMEIPKKWKKMGRTCGLEEATLKDIEDTVKQEKKKSHPNTMNMVCCVRTIEQLYKEEEEALTWLRVVKALEGPALGEQALADKLKELYNGDEPLEETPAYTQKPTKKEFNEKHAKVTWKQWQDARIAMKGLRSSLKKKYREVSLAITSMYVELGRDETGKYISEPVILCYANSKRALRRIIKKQVDCDCFLKRVFGDTKLSGSIDSVVVRVIEARMFRERLAAYPECGSKLDVPGESMRAGTATCLIYVTKSGVDELPSGEYLVTCQHLFEGLPPDSSITCGGVAGKYKYGREDKGLVDIAFVKLDNSKKFRNEILLHGGSQDKHKLSQVFDAKYCTEERCNCIDLNGITLVTNGAVTGSQKVQQTRFGENHNILQLKGYNDDVIHKSGDSGAPVTAHPAQHESAAQYAGKLVGIVYAKPYLLTDLLTGTFSGDDLADIGYTSCEAYFFAPSLKRINDAFEATIVQHVTSSFLDKWRRIGSLGLACAFSIFWCIVAVLVMKIINL